LNLDDGAPQTFTLRTFLPADRPHFTQRPSMHPVHDVDALLLLATTLASKRRPAQLAEVMAATDLLQGSIPLDVDLAAGFRRLAANDLIGGEADGLGLAALVKSGQVSPAELLEAAIARYHTNAVSTVEVLQELIEIAKEVRAARKRGDEVLIEIRDSGMGIAPPSLDHRFGFVRNRLGHDCLDHGAVLCCQL